jgi:hypothetical protein
MAFEKSPRPAIGKKYRDTFFRAADNLALAHPGHPDRHSRSESRVRDNGCFQGIFFRETGLIPIVTLDAIFPRGMGWRQCLFRRFRAAIAMVAVFLAVFLAEVFRQSAPSAVSAFRIGHHVFQHLSVMPIFFARSIGCCTFFPITAIHR